MEIRRRCLYCGGKLPTDNPTAKYCNKSHRTLAYLQRKKETGTDSLKGTDQIENKHEDIKPEQIVDQEQPHVNPQTHQQAEPIHRKKYTPTDFPEEKFDFPEFVPEKGLQEKKDVLYPVENPVPYSKRGLSVDQEMALDLSSVFNLNYNSLFSDNKEKENEHPFEQQNPDSVSSVSQNINDWEPQFFSEPEPQEIIPQYGTRKIKKHTPQAEQIIKEAIPNSSRMNVLCYEQSVLEDLHEKLLQKTKYFMASWNRLPEIKRLSFPEIRNGRSSFGSLIKNGTGHDTNEKIEFRFAQGTTGASNTFQRKELLKRIREYSVEFSERSKKATEYSMFLLTSDAFMDDEENYITNNEEYQSYQKEIQDWKQRKEAHEKKQIREHEEFLKQQQKIKQVQNPLTEQSKNPITDKNVFQNSEPGKQTENPQKKQFPVGNNKKNTLGLIVNSRDVHQYAGEVLEFSGRYGMFIGNPPARFMMIVHGQPGTGKSTFSSQLGKYLADDWGSVIYVSGEEGLSRTIEDRLNRTNSKSDNLFFVDCRCLEDIFKYVPKNKYKFIFIDSLKHLGIDYQGLLELKNHYENESIIAIQQSTKDGKMAGEQALKHEIDIEIIVSGGYAEIGKTRASNSSTGLVYDIFPEEGRTFEDGEVAVI